MARHEVVIRENTGALRETAPYVGNYISKEQIAMQAFASAVGAKCGLPPIQVIAIIGGAFEAIADLELEALVRVRFRQLAADEIERYLRAEQPYDCAGSAKSEGLGIALLDAIESDDPTALIGLPLIRTARLLRAAGCTLP